MNALPMALVSTYDLNLVALSLVIAVFASYTALDLVSQVTKAQGRTHLLWLAGGAGVMGSGIWSMHYIGMLAFRLPIPVLYDVPTVLFSLLAAIFASAIALFSVSRPTMSFSQVLFGGSIMGLGIATMHYTGMAAMRLPAMMHYDPLLVAASVAIAIGVSFVGLLLLFRFRERTTGWNWLKIASAIVMGLAISGMHYTGMEAVSFVPADVLVKMSYVVDVSALGILAIASGTAMLLAFTLTIPRHRGSYAWLPALIVAITMLPLAIGASALYFVEARLVAAGGERLEQATAEIADKTSRFLHERYGDVALMAKIFSLRADDRNYLTKHLLWVKVTYAPFYQWLAVTDQHGRIVAATDPATVGLDVSRTVWFQSVRHGRTVYVGDAQPDELAGGMVTVSFTAPIVSSKGEFLAAVTTRTAGTVLEDTLTQTIRTFQKQRGFTGAIEYQFMTYNGDVFVDSDLAHKGNANFKRMKLPSAMLSETNLSGFVEEEHARRHVPVVTGYARSHGYQGFPDLRWTVFVRMDRSDIVAPIREDLQYLGAIGLVAGIPLVGLLLWATGRVRKEHKLAQHERDLSRGYLDIAGAMILVLNVDQTVRLINKKGCEILGYQEGEIIGKRWVDHFLPERDRVRLDGLFDELKAGKPLEHVENAVLTKNGRERMISWHNTVLRDDEGTITGTLSSGEDITERKQMEAQAGELERLTTMSQLTDGIAHEMKNPLFILTGRLQMVKEKLDHREYGALPDDLQKIESATVRMTHIAERFSRLAQHPVFMPEPAAVQTVLKRTLELLADDMAKNRIAVTTALAPDLPAIQANPLKLQTAFTNLIRNALQAMAAAHGKGNLTVTAALQDGWIEVRIKDDGPGIAPEHRARLFEPFFTTKPAGQGVGMGLWAVRATVMALRGTIACETEVEKGATFIMRLPVVTPGDESG